MKVEVYPFRLEFKRPFKIASVERDGTDNLYVKLSKDGFTGWGEAVFPPYISENLNSALKSITKLKWDFSNEKELFELISESQSILIDEPSLACAVETAMLNWLSKSKSTTVTDILGLEPSTKKTSYTIGISSNDEIKKSIKEAPNVNYFKLKINQDEIERIIKCYQYHTNKPFVVDANQGFANYLIAEYWAKKLYDLGVEYFEQPFHKNDFKSHSKLAKSTLIPIIADESFQRFIDFEKIKNSFNGINVKIIKSGGLIEAKKSLLAAKDYGLKTILGCMSGSSTSIDNAKALSVLADYVDLDGSFLIKNDPNLELFK